MFLSFLHNSASAGVLYMREEYIKRVSLKRLRGMWASRWKGIFFQMVSSCTLRGAGSIKRPCNVFAQLSQHMKCVKSVLSSMALPAGCRKHLVWKSMESLNLEENMKFCKADWSDVEYQIRITMATEWHTFTAFTFCTALQSKTEIEYFLTMEFLA